MRWPWEKPEVRQDGNYTDLVVSALVATATGRVPAGLTAAVEIAAGAWGRAFAAAQLPEGVVGDLLRSHLQFIGRQLVTSGEVVFVVDDEPDLALVPASTCSVIGGHRRESWEYELTLPGPSETLTRTVGSGRVLHLQYSHDPDRPWKGLSPILASETTKKLLSNMEVRLSQEASTSVGYVIPVPNTQSASELQQDLRQLDGKLSLVDTVKEWGAGASSAPSSDFAPKRLGFDPPESLHTLRRQVEESILAACGLPPSFLTSADGTSGREDYRRFIAATINPTALVIGRQVAEFFDLDDFAFNFDLLHSTDTQGRARAVAALAGAGVPVAQALEIAGLMDGS